MNWPRVRKIARRVWIGAGLTFVAWMAWSFQPHGVTSDVLVSDSRVEVTEAMGAWRFVPTSSTDATGMVFLPGGLVDPKAYFPLARGVAETGHPVIVVALPWRMARSPEAEGVVLDAARIAMLEIGPGRGWVLSGHSRGAAIATRLIRRSLSDFQGLALVGTTHPRMDLSDLVLPVLKIGGTQDCVADRERSEEAAHWLPSHTEWEWIEGANHSQFGWYGSQLMDCRASISRERQQDRTQALLVGFMERIGGQKRAAPRGPTPP